MPMPGRYESPANRSRRRTNPGRPRHARPRRSTPNYRPREPRFFGKLYGLAGSDLSKRVHDILAAVGLLDRADHRAGTFSGGMKRRLNLGAAVVHRPGLLLLDEPTTGVDPQCRQPHLRAGERLNAAGMTIVYTSHYMEEVQTLCPRIGILDPANWWPATPSRIC